MSDKKDVVDLGDGYFAANTVLVRHNDRFLVEWVGSKPTWVVRRDLSDKLWEEFAPYPSVYLPKQTKVKNVNRTVDEDEKAKRFHRYRCRQSFCATCKENLLWEKNTQSKRLLFASAHIHVVGSDEVCLVTLCLRCNKSTRTLTIQRKSIVTFVGKTVDDYM